MVVIFVVHNKKDKRVVSKRNKKIANKRIKGSKIYVDKIGNHSFKVKIKKNILYVLFFLVDIGLIIYSARKNFVNIVVINDVEKMIGDTKLLFFGRNYITVVITLFFYLYILAFEKIYFKRKLKMSHVILFFLGLCLINLILFYCFTVRVY